jgi:hypothetical protein
MTTIDEQIAAVRFVEESYPISVPYRMALRAAVATLEQHKNAMAVVEEVRHLIDNIFHRGYHDNWKGTAKALAAFDAGEKPR